MESEFRPYIFTDERKDKATNAYNTLKRSMRVPAAIFTGLAGIAMLHDAYMQTFPSGQSAEYKRYELIQRGIMRSNPEDLEFIGEQVAEAIKMEALPGFKKEIREQKERHDRIKHSGLKAAYGFFFRNFRIGLGINTHNPKKKKIHPQNPARL
jgi:hypothetical protein